MVSHGENVSYDALDKLKKIVKKAARFPSLRLVPMTVIHTRLSYYVKDLTGSDYVLLGTTNKAELERAFAAKEDTPQKHKDIAETPAQKQARLEAEAQDAADRYQERCDALKVKYDVLWMLEYVATACAMEMYIDGGILVKTETLVHVDSTYNNQIEEIAAIHKRLSKEVYSKLWSGYAEDKALPQADPIHIEQLRRTHIIFDLLAAEVLGHRNTSETFKWAEAQTLTERIITRGLLLTLPANWNVPPVHRTRCNCWHCGKFAGNENGITKKEQAAGWVTDADALAVFCSQAHREEFYKTQATANTPTKKGKAKK